MKKKASRMKRNRSRGRYGWIAALVMIAAVVGAYTLYRQNQAPDNQTLEAAAFEGRWQRPDGGYVLELSGIGPNGIVKASYFNPRPINVSLSQWRKREDHLELFVELRDVKYPGSTYTLVYQSEKDRLYGIYYQAALGQMFEVEFVRTK